MNGITRSVQNITGELTKRLREKVFREKASGGATNVLQEIGRRTLGRNVI
jgi:hypothetical protein